MLADARSFELPGIYDAAVSVFDSLNHIMSLRELVNVFQNVYGTLREGALFLFDLNMAAGFETKWRNESSVVEDDEVCLLRSSYNPESRIAVFEATIFDNDDGWRRTDITLHQKCYSEREVLAALGEAGFEEVNSYSCDVSCRLGELQEDAERAFFIAIKPGAKGRAGKR
jgi:hypothetical protein